MGTQDPLDGLDLRNASPVDADDVAVLLQALGYPCDTDDAMERIASILDNDRQALVLARHAGAVCGLVAGSSATSPRSSMVARRGWRSPAVRSA